MRRNKKVKNKKNFSLKNSIEVYFEQECILHISLVEGKGLIIKATDIWDSNFDKIKLYTSLEEPSIKMSASFNGVLNNEETLELLWQLQEGQRLVDMLNSWLEKILTNTVEHPIDKVAEDSIPPEYDVKVGDVAIVTKYCTGNNIGELVRVTEVFDASSMNHGDKYNSVKTVNQKGKEFYEGDVKLHSSHAWTKSK